MAGKPWTPEEDAVIRLHAGKLQDKQLVLLLPGRTTASVKEHRPKVVGAPPKVPNWSAAELQILRANGSSTNDQLAELLPGRSHFAIHNKACELGVRERSRTTHNGTAWAPADDEALLRLYPHVSNDALRARFPDRTERAIHHRAWALGAKRSEAFWRRHYDTKISLKAYPPEVREVIRLSQKLNRALKKATNEQAHHQ